MYVLCMHIIYRCIYSTFIMLSKKSGNNVLLLRFFLRACCCDLLI